MAFEPPVLLAADWGTTNFRLFLFGADGEVIASHTANIGLKNLDVLSFEQALTSVMKGEFARPDLPILLSGMVGSRQGWIEAPYVNVPGGLDLVAANIVRAPSDKLNVHIVPGVSHTSPQGIINVMRGEETQIMGMLSEQAEQGLYCLPGTHSKWSSVEKGQITRFKTYMTGEMFQVLKSHSILGTLMTDEVYNEEAFLKGVDRGLEDLAFLSVIFSVRTEGLFGHVAPEALSSYLSGVLIGSEIGAEREKGIRPVTVIGDGRLITFYKSALDRAGFKDATYHAGDSASAAGLWAVAQKAKLI